MRCRRGANVQEVRDDELTGSELRTTRRRGDDGLPNPQKQQRGGDKRVPETEELNDENLTGSNKESEIRR